MSKATLKKALAALTSEQKDQLLLDLYAARPEAKEYLDFFINPDIDRLIDKTAEAIDKEVNRRGRYGYNKPRITKIRALIKKIATLYPGPEYVIDIMARTVEAAARTSMTGHWFTGAHEAALARIMVDALTEADAAGILAPTLTRFRHLIDTMASASRAATSLRQCLKNALEQTLQKCPD
ncbi:MAG: DUF6155 family protein [Alloprevotella sp.]|nr:DUF6155 family protein [Alloprevotella sp.]